ncbi:MAG: CHAT domain-containing protein [Deltaproteobacteria bacterium]|nr:CHAT domain-containing protein [Deltaproteobacteria bacterium]
MPPHARLRARGLALLAALLLAPVAARAAAPTGKNGGAPPDATAPSEPAATAALCAGRAAGPEHDICAQFCDAWPAGPGCAFVRRWGVAGANTLVRAAQRGEAFLAAAAAEGIGADDAALLRMHADYGGFVAGPWAPEPTLDVAHQMRADAGRDALYRGTKAARAGQADVAKRELGAAVEGLAAGWGADHPNVAIALQNLGHVLLAAGDLAGARRALERAKAIRAKAYPPTHPLLALTEVELAGVEQAAGDLVAAADHAQRGYDALRAVLGPEHPETLTAENNLAFLLSARGDEAAAAPLRAEVARAREIVDGPTAETTFTAIMNLAVGYLETGEPQKALETLTALAARAEAALGAKSPDLGAILYNLARAQEATGALDAATESMRRALALVESAGPAYAAKAEAARVGLADLELSLGDVTAAIVVFQADFERRMATVGEKHPATGEAAAKVARAMLAAGLAAEAKPYAEASMWIASQAGEGDATLGRRQSLYATILQQLGQAKDAEEHARAAMTRLERALGADHTDAIAARANLAGILAARGALAESRELVRGVAEKIAAVRGATSHAALAASYNVAVLDAQLGDFDAALARATALATTGWAAFVARVEAAPNPVAPYGVLLDLRPVLELERDLRLARGDVAGAFAAALRSQGLGGRGERLWRALHGGKAAADAARAALSADPKALCKALGHERSGLVLYVSAADFRPSARAGLAAGERPAARVGAFVVPPGGGCRPTFVDAGAGSAVAGLVDGWRKALDGARDCYAKRGNPAFCKRDFDAVDAAGGALRAAVWDPAAKALGKVRRALIVPEGALTRVAFDALPAEGDGGAYLLEGWELAYAVDPGALLRPPSRSAAAGALVVGDLDYQAALPEAEALAAWQRCGVAGCGASDAGAVAVADLRAAGEVGAAACGYGATWPSLGATEAPAVAKALGAVAGGGATWLATGGGAEEGALRAAFSGRRVIHLATHGFFAPPTTCGVHALAGGSGATAEGLLAAALDGSTPVMDPLRLSGVAVSGANRKDAPGPAEDGLLSAREVASLDLSGTELVALSACETGLGVDVGGESFQGLVGSFLMAGAERAIVSLWQVPSEATGELFEGFYATFAKVAPKKGDDRALAAFRDARRALVKGLRERGLARSAFLWGAFIPVSGVAGGY